MHFLYNATDELLDSIQVSLLIIRGAKMNKKTIAGVSPLDLRNQRVASYETLTQKELNFDQSWQEAAVIKIS